MAHSKFSSFWRQQTRKTGAATLERPRSGLIESNRILLHQSKDEAVGPQQLEETNERVRE